MVKDDKAGVKLVLQQDGKPAASLEVKLEKIAQATGWLSRAWAWLVVHLPLFLSLAAFIAGLWHFDKELKSQATTLNKTLAAQAERQKQAFEDSQHQEYWKEQVKLYEEAVLAAGAIAAESEFKSVNGNLKDKFWSLFHGPMSLVESPEVKRAMQAFAGVLLAWEQSGRKPPEIETLAYQLAHCCRESLERTWPASVRRALPTQCPWMCTDWQNCSDAGAGRWDAGTLGGVR